MMLQITVYKRLTQLTLSKFRVWMYRSQLSFTILIAWKCSTNYLIIVLLLWSKGFLNQMISVIQMARIGMCFGETRRISLRFFKGLISTNALITFLIALKLLAKTDFGLITWELEISLAQKTLTLFLKHSCCHRSSMNSIDAFSLCSKQSQRGTLGLSSHQTLAKAKAFI